MKLQLHSTPDFAKFGITLLLKLNNQTLPITNHTKIPGNTLDQWFLTWGCMPTRSTFDFLGKQLDVLVITAQDPKLTF